MIGLDGNPMLVLLLTQSVEIPVGFGLDPDP